MRIVTSICCFHPHSPPILGILTPRNVALSVETIFLLYGRNTGPHNFITLHIAFIVMCYRWNEQCEWFQKQALVSDLFAQKLATFSKNGKSRKDEGLKKFVTGRQPLRYMENI
ncbi:hypothetical protein AVEN_96769-1 [Araneus ventricosus]|uniref:Uncharacterized protein n=1 Tax=Araneus ventricosus TaxID=182803 RepID=A0A4Y2IKY3_ARAVE|nr:hypothetical protein AVEN_96769-1 [Araneus ventricosus]